MSSANRDLLADLLAQYPNLTDQNHRITSEPTGRYNCVAWVNRERETWFEPGFSWPDDISVGDDEPDLDAYVAFFRRWGFELCQTSELEQGFLKIALYGHQGFFEHVAKQLPSGAWSSKNGRLHDLRHADLQALGGSGVLQYAEPTVFMKRPYEGESMALEETGLVFL